MGMQLVKYDDMRRAVQSVSHIDEALEIKDRAAALALYARQRHDPELSRWMAEIKLRARRRIGEISRELEKGKPYKGHGHELSSTGKFKGTALKEANISLTEAFRCERLAAVPEEKFEAYINQKTEKGKEVNADEVIRIITKETKQAERTAPREKGCCTDDLQKLIDEGRKFGCIYADPPWPYANQATRSATSNEYSIMSINKISALPILKLAEDNAHLHLWTTNAFIFDCQSIMREWGFEYKSMLIWVKPSIGIGNYWRVSHEILLFGLRGKCPFQAHDEISWIQTERCQHSAKPEIFRKKIERVSPGPYLELFGRNSMEGWVVWGNEIERDVFYKCVEATG